jgi:hypothetical protein
MSCHRPGDAGGEGATAFRPRAFEDPIDMAGRRPELILQIGL